MFQLTCGAILHVDREMEEEALALTRATTKNTKVVNILPEYLQLFINNSEGKSTI
eukprot:m.12532 g.12532  ORF g.12532 m.12532 type:complete len:55 (+) comp4664_c0_seq1:2976-3140(+)